MIGFHEMAKDEARHGKALLGLLQRYFAVDMAKEKAAATVNKASEKAAEAASIVGEAANKAAEALGNLLKK